MEISGSASLATVVNAALQQQQFGFKVLKQQGQVASELMAVATQIGAPATPAAANGLGQNLDMRV